MLASIAAISLNSTTDSADNLRRSEALIANAVDAGASFVALPEAFSWMGPDNEKLDHAEDLNGPTLTTCSQWARRWGITLLAGTILERLPHGRMHNTSVLFGPRGESLATYRKIHLFDVDVGDGPPYRESSLVEAGNTPVAARTPLGTVGLSVCYDLRFPELYRYLVAQGATILAVPSAFTARTGRDHWEVLLRARAIENQCYLVAPAQWGFHPMGAGRPGRSTYGHAMIVDPWGTIVAQQPEGDGVALAAYDDAYLSNVRRQLPALHHRKIGVA